MAQEAEEVGTAAAPAADASPPEVEQFFEAEGFDDEKDGAAAAAVGLEGLGLEEEGRDADKARAAKEDGNRLYQAGDNEGALRQYTRAIRRCPFQYDKERELIRARERALRMDEENVPAPASEAQGGPTAAPASSSSSTGGQKEDSKQEEEEEEEEEEPFAEHKEEAAVYYCNRAACLVNLSRDQEAVEDCTVALKLRPDYLKALMRRAQASERLDKLEDALRDYKRAAELEPGNRVAKSKIPGLERACQERMEKLKEETMSKLKELGNSVLSNFGLSLDNFKMQQDPNTGSYSISFQR